MEEWNSFDTVFVFSLGKIEKQNGFIFCSVESRNEEWNGIFLAQVTSLL